MVFFVQFVFVWTVSEMVGHEMTIKTVLEQSCQYDFVVWFGSIQIRDMV